MPYNTIATVINMIIGKTTLLPPIISAVLKRVNIVKYFKFASLPPMLASICMRNRVGKSRKYISDFFPLTEPYVRTSHTAPGKT